MTNGFRVTLRALCGAAAGGCLLAATAAAQTLPMEVRTMDETAVPGGVLQLKLEVTEPRPIFTGGGGWSFDGYSDFLGLAVGGSADSAAVGVMRGAGMKLRMVAPSNDLAVADYPILMTALRVPASRIPGQTSVANITIDSFTGPPNDPSQSPFADWTKVYLPYCNQDVFAGGGVVEQLGATSVPRYGAVNMRAAIEMVRNVIWQKMDAEGGAGFRPDEVVALFGGWSAGGYGTLYNYHWLLDDLQWPRTAAFPDAGMALDNGSIVGVRGLGPVKIPAWGARNNLPPYCFTGDCSVGEVIFNAIAPRLRNAPEQQMLILGNQRDQTQQGDAFFDDEAFFIDTMRGTYCRTKDLNGIHWYLTSASDRSVHVVSLRPEFWAGAVAGETMRDWFRHAIEDPDTLQSRAEEGDFQTAVPGVHPFPCDVAP